MGKLLSVRSLIWRKHVWPVRYRTPAAEAYRSMADSAVHLHANSAISLPCCMTDEQRYRSSQFILIYSRPRGSLCPHKHFHCIRKPHYLHNCCLRIKRLFLIAVHCRSLWPRRLRPGISLFEHWNHGFEPHRRHGCLFVFILCLR
jgi:hypothetical protein